MKLARHLISLRVHLSTAQLAWIGSFVAEFHGVDVIRDLLKDFVGEGLLRYSKIPLNRSDNPSMLFVPIDNGKAMPYRQFSLNSSNVFAF